MICLHVITFYYIYADQKGLFCYDSTYSDGGFCGPCVLRGYLSSLGSK